MCLTCPIASNIVHLHLRRHFALAVIVVPLAAVVLTISVANESLMSILAVFKFLACTCIHLQNKAFSCHTYHL
jgi:hypothetical protein